MALKKLAELTKIGSELTKNGSELTKTSIEISTKPPSSSGDAPNFGAAALLDGWPR